MTLKAIVQSLDEVAEAVRDQYAAQGDGTFRLAVDGVEFPDAVQGLKSSLSKTQRELRELKEKFDGIDPEEHRALVEAKEKEEADKHRKKNDWESREEQLRKNNEIELGKKDAEVAKWKAAFTQVAMSDSAKGAIAKHGGIVDLLLPHVMKNLSIVEEGGAPVVRVVDENGQVQIGGPKAEPVTVEDWVKGMREKDLYKAAFAASPASGSGTPPPTTPQGGGGPGASVRTSDAQAIADAAADIVAGKTQLVPSTA